jgi:hypothetical protein
VKQRYTDQAGVREKRVVDVMFAIVLDIITIDHVSPR